jgi:hypothetical protein
MSRVVLPLSRILTGCIVAWLSLPRGVFLGIMEAVGAQAGTAPQAGDITGLSLFFHGHGRP